MQNKDILVKKLQEINTSTELNRLIRLPIKKFAQELVEEKGFFQSDLDFKLFVLEYLEKTFKDDMSEWPIRYYEDDEELEEINEEALTDDFIQEQLGGLPSPNYQKR